MDTRSYKLHEIAQKIDGDVDGDGEIPIRGVAGLREARPGDISFLAHRHYEDLLKTTRASAVIVSRSLETKMPIVRVDDPYLGLVKVLSVFYPTGPVPVPKGIHELAVVDPSAVIAEDVSVGPFCQVGAGVSIGRGSTLTFGVYVGEETTIGEDCYFYPNVTVRERCEIGSRVMLHAGCVIGSDGFGYTREKEIARKIPQIGTVRIEDDVEIGACAAIDRATLGVTRVGKGSKLDNLVQVGHNVTIGENNLIAGQTGIGGSTELGDGVIMGGQAGVRGHLSIGDGAQVGAKTGVWGTVRAGEKVFGFPAREFRLATRIHGALARLPDMLSRVRALEKKLAELEKGGSSDSSAADDS